MGSTVAEDDENQTKNSMVEEHIADLDEKDPSLHCLNFTYGSNWPDSIAWSGDGRIGVITENGIYVLTIISSNKRKRAGVSVGLKVESTVIENISTVRHDTGIDTHSFSNRSKKTFIQRAEYLCDRTTLTREDYLSNHDQFAAFSWSPVGCTSDGGCCLATVGGNGTFHIHKLKTQIGTWSVAIKCTDHLHKYLKDHCWLNKNPTLKSPTNVDDEPTKKKKKIISDDLISDFYENRYRKHLLYTSTICWSSDILSCKSCVKNQNEDNIYYANYLNNFAKCRHSKVFLLSASRTGHFFIWLVTLDLLNINDSMKLLFYWRADKANSYPVSLAWFQESDNHVYIAAGFTNGCVSVYDLQIQEINDEYHFNHSHTLDVWKDNDLLSASFLCWIMSKDSVLCLVAAKGTDIVMFKTAKQEDDVNLVCLSCEIAPSCHTSPITSLHCINNKFVMSSSDAATQYFDIDNETLPFCENSILRGFRCLGIDADKSMCMYVRVSCADRFLLHQVSFVKQMEVSFLPFLPPNVIAENILNNRTQELDMCAREYFSLSASEGFLLPDILHKYCDEPESYKKSLHELQIYLYFNQLRYMRQTGLRESSLTREEVNTNTLEEQFNDPVIKKLEHTIELMFYKEMLSKCLQLLEFGWLEESTQGSLTLLLIADWLVQNELSSNYSELPNQCYTLLGDIVSLEKLEKLSVNEKSSETTSGCGNISEDESTRGTIKSSKCQEESKATEITGETCVPRMIFPLRNLEVPREKCPYCNVEVAFNSLKISQCTNGHSFQRCHLTLRIMTKKMSRRCSSCERRVSQKSFDAVLNVDSIMLNIDTCPFCGCTFRDVGW